MTINLSRTVTVVPATRQKQARRILWQPFATQENCLLKNLFLVWQNASILDYKRANLLFINYTPFMSYCQLLHNYKNNVYLVY
jgi:hypothetical protein